jgi:hypothetical protein
MNTSNLIHLFPIVDTSPFLFGGPNIPNNQEQQEFDENHEPVEEWYDEDGIPIQMEWPEDESN